jgi:hypothetical protein
MRAVDIPLVGCVPAPIRPNTEFPPDFEQMKSSRTMRKSLTLLIACGGIASAATIVQVETYAFVPAGSQTLVFDKFDTLGGTRTLLSVTIEHTMTKKGGSLFVDNDSSVGGTGTIAQTTTIILSGRPMIDDNGDDLSSKSLTATTTYAATVGADDGDGAGYQASGVDADGITFADSTVTSSGEVGSAYLSSYTGTNTFTLTASGTQGVDVSSISGVAGSFSPASTEGFVTITYTYVPEPDTTLLGGIGVLLLIRRRFR